MGTALITGAYGYVGSRIRSQLEAAGWKTIALVRKPRAQDSAAVWRLGEAPPRQVLRGADALVHCAYDFTPRREADIQRINVAGTRVLLRAVRDSGVARVLCLSSMSAYGGTTQLYGRAKLAIEAETTAVEGVAIRPGLVYGDEPGGIVGTIMRLAGLPLVPLIGANALHFPVHDEDLACAVVDVLQAPAWEPEVFGVAQLDAVPFRTIVTVLSARYGLHPHLVPLPWRPARALLRMVEAIGIVLPLRADSVLGLVRPAPFVPRSTRFPLIARTLDAES